MTIEERQRRDLEDMRRNTIIWIAGLVWIGSSYAIQDPARDPFDAAERAVFSYAMLVLIPLVTAAFVVTWVGILRRRRG